MIFAATELTLNRAKNATFAKIIAGPKKDTFVVHEELLVYHSPYFRAALTGGFKKPKRKSLH